MKKTTKGNSVIIVHSVVSRYQKGKQKIRVLLPSNYCRKKKIRTLYVLPVETGSNSKYGDVLEILKKMNAHNKYNVIIVQPEFEKMPWYGEHPKNLKIRQESYFTDFVIPFIEKHYGAKAEKYHRYLLGFSKSGFGAFSIIFRNPVIIGFAAAYDAPFFFDSVGQFKMGSIFGNIKNFRLFCPDLCASKTGKSFKNKTRLVLSGGNQLWGRDVRQMRSVLKKHGVKHLFVNIAKTEHRWHKKWLKPVISKLLKL